MAYLNHITPATSNGKPSYSGATRKSSPQEESRIENAMRQGGASEEEIDKALGNYRDSRSSTVANPKSNKPQSLDPTLQRQALSHARVGLHGGFGFNSQKTYSAVHGRDRSYADQYAKDEQAREEAHFSRSGLRSEQQSENEQSSQVIRNGQEASFSNADERARILDESTRKENGIGKRINHSEIQALTTHWDVMADPSVSAKIAERHGMTEMRFFNQSEESRMAMYKAYLAEKGIGQQAQRMPEQAEMPSTLKQLEALSALRRAKIPDNIAELHKAKVEALNPSSVEPLQVDTNTPKIVKSAERTVLEQLDPMNKNNIPSRAHDLKENVKAWASPDKPIGKGRANMMGVVEDTEGHDIADSITKGVSAVVGWKGEKLTDNMKRKEGVLLPINTEIQDEKTESRTKDSE